MAPLIHRNTEDKLYAYIAGICIKLKCYPKKIGGHLNHIHVLVQLSKTVSVAELVEILKTRSSVWMKSGNLQMNNFFWQNGYAVFAVEHCSVIGVARYIANQHEHHDKISFEEEYRSLLRENDIQFDEVYVWD